MPSSRHATLFHCPRSFGFTLPELLVVVAILVFVMLAAFPIIGSMRRDLAVSTATNTVSVTVAAARAHSTKRVITGNINFNTSGTGGPNYSTLPWGGAAALFCPGGEVRIVEAWESAEDQNGDPLATYKYADITDPNYLAPSYGFFDVESFDYVQMPDTSGVVGVYRNGGNLELISPPFAVRFTNDGNLVTQGPDNRTYAEPEGWVYYPKLGEIKTTPPTYNRGDTNDERSEASGNPKSWASDAVNDATDNLSRELPFTRIEPVIGVIVYNRSAFEGVVNTLGLTSMPWWLVVPTGDSDFDNAVVGNPDNIASDAVLSNDEKLAAWLLNNNNDDARILMINRYSGAVIRESDIR